MYPNYVGSEAVLASENMVFGQHFCDEEAFNACLHPFIRNAVGCMEFGGCFLNKRLNRNNDGGTTRRTTDIFQLATTVLFQNPVQNFALAPNNLKDVSPVCVDYMKTVPTTWDETRFIDGYPGKYVVLARRHGDTWYLAAVNAGKEIVKLKLDLDMFAGKTVSLYKDDKRRTSTCDVESKRKRKSATGNPSTGRCCIGEQLDDISFGCEFGINTLIPNSHFICYLLVAWWQQYLLCNK